ncbi:MAG: hypothetical protein IJ590_04870, partial [Rickettsiales bacterium]|nr:hypothetical protein [Rickettsiales bacterium]
RAKIQRIIFEFDYYEKAFHQFYDTYRVAPGNLSVSDCNKYATFKNALNCNGKFLTQNRRNQSVMGGDLAYGSVSNAMKQMQIAGLIEGDKNLYAAGIGTSTGCNWNNPGYQCSVNRDKTIIISGNTNGGFNNGTGPHYFPYSSYDSIAYIQPMGYHIDKWAQHGGYKNFSDWTYCGSNTYSNSSMPHEFQNLVYQRALNHHNTLTILRQATVSRDVLVPKTSALPAKLASEIDAKLDDGRPGTGRILAMKGGNAHKPGATEDEHLANCYDKMADQVDKAIYHSGTDLKHGCNITYVMEDMK